MRVCVFNRSYWPDDGATGQLLAQLCEDLVARHGMEVTVVCGERPGDGGRGFGLVRRETRNGVEILRARGTTFDKSRFAGRVAPEGRLRADAGFGPSLRFRLPHIYGAAGGECDLKFCTPHPRC